MTAADLLEKIKGNTRLYEILSWMADVGIALIPAKSGYRIVPGEGWQPGEWEQERKWLLPYTKELMAALKA